jgi:hypothetical protein
VVLWYGAHFTDDIHAAQTTAISSDPTSCPATGNPEPTPNRRSYGTPREAVSRDGRATIIDAWIEDYRSLGYLTPTEYRTAALVSTCATQAA